MVQIPKPTNEVNRLFALRALQILHSPSERKYDDVVAQAAKIFDAPIALISLVEEEYQWFKANLGLDAERAGRDVSFCTYAILGTEPFVVEDASIVPQFADNPLVLGYPHIRFYVGAPLIDSDGNALGTLCVIDQKPHTPTKLQLDKLKALASEVMSMMLADAALNLHSSAVRPALGSSTLPSFFIGLGPSNEVIQYGIRGQCQMFDHARAFDLPQVFGKSSSVIASLANLCRESGLTVQAESTFDAKGRDPETSIHVTISRFGDGCVRIVGTDPRDRDRRESFLNLQREQYRHIIENVQDIIFCTDPETNFTFLNPAWVTCTGVPLSDSLFHQVYEFVPACFQGCVKEMFDLVSSGQEDVADLEFPITNTQGEQRWLQAHVKSLRADTGELIGFTGSMHDLTVRRNAELAESSHFEFTRILSAVSAQFIDVDADHVGDAISRALQAIGDHGDLDGVYVGLLADDGLSFSIGHEWTNNPAVSVKSMTQGVSLLSRPWLKGVLEGLEPIRVGDISTMPEEAEGERRFLAEAEIGAMVIVPLISRHSCHGFVTYYLRNRTREWTDDFFELLKSAANSMSAILTRAKAERAVRRLNDHQIATSQLRVEMALSCADIVLFTLDRYAKVTFAQGKMLNSVLDGSRLKLGKSGYEVFREPVVIEHILAAYLGDEREETHLVDGRYLTTRYAPIRSSLGAIEGMIGISVDVTKQRELEKRLGDSRRLEAIGALSAGVAHEINTPIHAIIANLEFLLDSFQERQKLFSAHQALFDRLEADCTYPDEREHILAVAEEISLPMLSKEIPLAAEQSLDAARRVGSIVHSLKEVCHPGEDSRVLSDLNHLIETAITLSRNEWKYTASLELELDQTLPAVECLPNEIVRCILNLIVNASHAVADKFEPTGELGIIRICTRALGAEIDISISDNGTGIPADIQNKVFDPFFTTKDPGRGTGQGLSLAYAAVVERHKGTLSLESEVGKGTTFFVRIPIRTASLASAA